jgi:hypothetical protein
MSPVTVTSSLTACTFRIVLSDAMSSGLRAPAYTNQPCDASA